MVLFKKKFYFFEITDCWFIHKFHLFDLFRLRVYSYVTNPVKFPFFYKKVSSYTIELSLLDSVDLIQSRFNSTNRNEINRAIREKIETDYSYNIDLFVGIYNEFASNKNIYPVKKRNLINIGKSLQLSFAYHNNIPIVAHAYITDTQNGIARLYLSGSKRLTGSIEKKLVGYANKLLMYNDMLYFKKSGFLKYDFGGYAMNTKNKNLQGINDFKKSFGGIIKKCDSYYTHFFYFLKRLSEKVDNRYK